MSDEPVAVRGTRRAMKELVDGTIRVQIDIDPPERAAFLKLFPEIDMAVALAPLVGTAAGFCKHDAPHGEQKVGPLCLLAVKWCVDVVFHEWLQTVYPATWNGALAGKTVEPDELAARIMREVCNVQSRKEFDTNEAAAQRFHEKFRVPYAVFLRESSGNG